MTKKSCKCTCPKSSRPSPQKRVEQERKKLMKELQKIGQYTSSKSEPKEISFWSKRDEYNLDELDKQIRRMENIREAERKQYEKAEKNRRELEAAIKVGFVKKNY